MTIVRRAVQLVFKSKDGTTLCKFKGGKYPLSGVVLETGKATRAVFVNAKGAEFGSMRVTGPYGKTGLALSSNHLFQGATVTLSYLQVEGATL